LRTPCIRCGEEKSLAHHEDYDKPLEVMWLCQPCHKQRHKELKQDF
jgi:ribosomal protein S27AE